MKEWEFPTKPPVAPEKIAPGKKKDKKKSKSKPKTSWSLPKLPSPFSARRNPTDIRDSPSPSGSIRDSPSSSSNIRDSPSSSSNIRDSPSPSGSIRDSSGSIRDSSGSIRDSSGSIRDSQSAKYGSERGQSKPPKKSKSAENHTKVRGIRVRTDPDFKLYVTLDNENFQSLLKLCGIAKRSKNSPPIEVVIKQMAKGTNTRFILENQREYFEWGLDDAGVPRAVKNKHGMSGQDLQRLFNHQEFKQFIENLRGETDW